MLQHISSQYITSWFMLILYMLSALSVVSNRNIYIIKILNNNMNPLLTTDITDTISISLDGLLLYYGHFDLSGIVPIRIHPRFAKHPWFHLGF